MITYKDFTISPSGSKFFVRLTDGEGSCRYMLMDGTIGNLYSSECIAFSNLEEVDEVLEKCYKHKVFVARTKKEII